MSEFAAAIFTFAFTGAVLLFGYLTDIEPRKSTRFSPLNNERSTIGSLEIEIAAVETSQQPLSARPANYSGRTTQPHTMPGSLIAG